MFCFFSHVYPPENKMKQILPLLYNICITK
nr:MAG TPA: hypothetical protein [Caudoviricetes sp.]DAV32859.1 MAG TPA: hypothetical protein [Caudoviricetes sp.]